jgi:hypothetical protein
MRKRQFREKQNSLQQGFCFRDIQDSLEVHYPIHPLTNLTVTIEDDRDCRYLVACNAVTTPCHRRAR